MLLQNPNEDTPADDDVHHRRILRGAQSQQSPMAAHARLVEICAIDYNEVCISICMANTQKN